LVLSSAVEDLLDRTFPRHWTIPRRAAIIEYSSEHGRQAAGAGRARPVDLSMQSNITRQFRSSVAPALLGTVATALLTLALYWLQPGALPVALLFIVVLVMVSLSGDLLASVWVSLIAVASLDYFFTPPQFRLGPIREARDVVTLVGFLTTALVINRLIRRMRQSFKEVEAAHEQLRLVIDTVPILLTSAQADGALELVNQQWRDFLGLSTEEIRSGGWEGALHPDDRNRLVREWRTALASGVPLESEARMRRADGEYRWLLFRAVPLRDQDDRIVRWYGTGTDIEERKRAEEKVRQIDSERRAAIDRIPALVWSSLPDGSSDFNSARWLEYTGLSEEEARDWGYKYVIHPEDYQDRVADWATHFATGEPIETEARLRRADGEYRWFLHRAVPLRDDRGNIVKWYGTSTDIEDRKRAEESLRDHARLLDLTHDTVFVRDMSDAITYWNRGAEALYGWSRDEAVGRITHQLTQTIFPAPLDEINEELLRTGRWEGELVHTKRDGTQVVVASRWSLQRDELGRPAAILETNNDITERKRLDNELRRSQTYLIEAQELGNTGSWGRRISTGEIYWSEEVFRIFGVDPRTTTPHRNLLTQLWHADDREFADRTIDDAVREKRNYEMDVRIVRPDGSIRYVHIRGQPVFDETGETDEFIGVIMDITNRKRTERALRRARERALEARFAAVLEERTRLARDIHDTLLQGFTGIALKLVAAINRVTGPPESVSALRDLVSLAQQTLTDARRAVWDLRSPALAGDFPAALRTAVEDCVRGTTLGLEFDIGGPLQPVNPDVEAVVVRVAQEAVTNVVKHADARMVRVRLSFETRRVRLSVIDDGRGFTVESNFQAYGGHWGLLGMRERASQVHGKLSLRSTPGHGTELVLLVPYTVRHESPAPSPSTSGS
jgi:PAS domain S-box-containing protein